MKSNIETSRLIEEVGRRPTIWDKKLADYNDRLARKKCWEELTEVFAPSKISKKEKQELSEHLQNRWKNIRDRFSRDWKINGSKEKSQYIYAPKLKFLQKSMKVQKNSRSDDNIVSKVRRTSSSSAKKSKPLQGNRTKTRTANSFVTSKSTPPVPLEPLSVPEEDSNPPLEKRTRSGNCLVTSNKLPSASSEILNMPEEEMIPPPETRTDNTSVSSKNAPSFPSEILYVTEEESKPPPEKRTRIHTNSIESKLIEFLERNMMELQDVTKNSQDEDRLFLLSLLPSLKMIQPQCQLRAKIEILSVLDKYTKMYEELDMLCQPQILEVRHSVDQ